MNGQVNELTHRGLFNGQEYNPTGESSKGGRNIVAEIWVAFTQIQRFETAVHKQQMERSLMHWVFPMNMVTVSTNWFESCSSD